jgi:hypothetical protein
MATRPLSSSSVKEPLRPIVLSMATSTKFLGAARLSNRHVPEAATTEHVGEQVAGVVEQALLHLGFLLLVDAGRLTPAPITATHQSAC